MFKLYLVLETKAYLELQKKIGINYRVAIGDWRVCI